MRNEPHNDLNDDYHDLADGEGWNVFSSIGTSDAGSLRIERVDFSDEHDGPVFDDDEQAWEHVITRAIAGSTPHLQAIKEVFEDNPCEKEFVTTRFPSLVRLVEEKLTSQMEAQNA